MNPVPPELWYVPFPFSEGKNAHFPHQRLLPQFTPLCPGNWWVHTRMVYLPMGYIYALRLSAPLTEFTQSLREELYTEPYDQIDWNRQRNNVSVADLYTPHTKLMDVLNGKCTQIDRSPVPNPIHLCIFIELMTYYEMLPTKFNWLRHLALRETIKQVQMEDENTFFLDIGPVNKVMNWLVVYYHYGKDSREFREHVKRNLDFMWMGPEGMMMNGTNGSQLWDCAFIVQALAEANLSSNPEYRQNMIKALEFLDTTQVSKTPVS